MYLGMLMFSAFMHAYLLDLLDLQSIVETAMQNSLVCLESTGKNGIQEVDCP